MWEHLREISLGAVEGFVRLLKVMGGLIWEIQLLSIAPFLIREYRYAMAHPDTGQQYFVADSPVRDDDLGPGQYVDDCVRVLRATSTEALLQELRRRHKG